MQYVNPSKSSGSRPVSHSFIQIPATNNVSSSFPFYQAPRTTLSNVVASVEPQSSFPFSTQSYGGLDLFHGTAPTNPCPDTPQRLMVSQPTSNPFMYNDELYSSMAYLEMLSDNQQLSQPSSPAHSQEDTTGYYHADVVNDDNQQYTGCPFDELPWKSCSPVESNPENTSAYSQPQLTSPANRKASTARRKRAAKYICDMCGASLTAKHNLISHQNVHLGIKPFCCEICQKGFTAKATYRRHIKTVHRDQA